MGKEVSYEAYSNQYCLGEQNCPLAQIDKYYKEGLIGPDMEEYRRVCGAVGLENATGQYLPFTDQVLDEEAEPEDLPPSLQSVVQEEIGIYECSFGVPKQEHDSTICGSSLIVNNEPLFAYGTVRSAMDLMIREWHEYRDEVPMILS